MDSRVGLLLLMACLIVGIFGCEDGNCHLNPFPVRTIKEVTISHGKAGASSSWRDAPWSDPNNAFRRDITRSWGSGIYSNGVRTPMPHLIWYDFAAANAFIPAEVSFRTRQDKVENVSLGPSKWQFVATNDLPCNENAAWTILCEDLSGEPFKKFSDIKFCVVPPQMSKKFRCLGLRILKDSGYGNEVCVQSLRFWEKVNV